MFKKFARWILANEINEAEIKLDIAKARVEAEKAAFDDLHADHLRAEGVISQVFHGTKGIRSGTVQKVYRIVSDYYKGE